MEGRQQTTSKRQLKLIKVVKANDDIFENSLATTSGNLQIISDQDKDNNHNDYTYIDHLKDFFENEMGACYVKNDVSNASIVRHFCSKMQTDDPFYIVDLSYFVKRYLQWFHYLPRVQPYYAIKCNPNEFIIKTLAHQDIGFDCASTDELDLVLSTCPNINCEKKVIYSHPCKPISHIKYFRQHNVQMTVIDNEDELVKIKEYWPDAKVLLRLKITKNGNSMSTKFGANQYRILKLLKLAQQMNINLVGCSFHVGSQCSDRNLYEQTLLFARKIFDLAQTEEYGGFKFTILDIGGGFPVQFSEVAKLLRDMIDKLFPEEGIHLISEPGRYFTSESTILVCNITARRIHNKDYNLEEDDEEQKEKKERHTQITKEEDEHDLIREAEIFYYINDGIYGTFNAIIFDQKLFFVNYMRKDMKKEKEGEEKEYQSVIFGPTCDGIDYIANSISLPLLNIGDYLWFSNVGSYTNSCASSFNGFKTKKYFSIWKS